MFHMFDKRRYCCRVNIGFSLVSWIIVIINWYKIVCHDHYFGGDITNRSSDNTSSTTLTTMAITTQKKHSTPWYVQKCWRHSYYTVYAVCVWLRAFCIFYFARETKKVRRPDSAVFRRTFRTYILQAFVSFELLREYINNDDCNGILKCFHCPRTRYARSVQRREIGSNIRVFHVTYKMASFNETSELRQSGQRT